MFFFFMHIKIWHYSKTMLLNDRQLAITHFTQPFPNFNGYTFEVWKLLSNFIPYFIMEVTIYSCWDLSQTTSVKGAPAVVAAISVCDAELWHLSYTNPSVDWTGIFSTASKLSVAQIICKNVFEIGWFLTGLGHKRCTIPYCDVLESVSSWAMSDIRQ